MIRDAQLYDAAAIVAIYNPYVRDTTISFEEAPLTTEEMAERIERVTEKYPWLVYEEDGEILGYAYATSWRARKAYQYTVEVTAYVAPSTHKRGIGTQLYTALIGELRARGFHAAIGAIALPNPASVAFHEKLGFVKVGQVREAGRKFNRWVDIGFWELLL